MIGGLGACRRALLVVPLLVLTLAAAGACGAGSHEVVVEPDVGVVSLEVGETLVVDLGTINVSVGDDWQVAREPDPSVLAAGEARSRHLGEDGETGAGDELTYTFVARGEGTTTIELQYAFRGSTAPEDTGGVEDPRPVIEVTVRRPG